MPQQHQQAYPQVTQAYPFQPQQQPPLQSHRSPMGQMDGPNFAAWGMNDATAQFGMQLGQSAVAAGQDYVQKNVRHIPLLDLFPMHSANHIYVVWRLCPIDNSKTPLQRIKLIRGL
jgi:hypothetical protein